MATCQVIFTGDTLPDWIELVPAGPDINALDGRKFRNTRPDSVVAEFNRQPLQLPIDWEHATEIKAPMGDPAPAAGWITGLEVRAGSIWGKVDWTPRGAESLRNKEYRYVSPSFYHDDAGDVLELTSAGLTNRPALDLMALARRAADEPDEKQAARARAKEIAMNPELLKLLGLDEKATPEQVAKAVADLMVAQSAKDAALSTVQAELATARAAVPDLNRFVPRADFDAANARASGAEKKLADIEAADLKSRVDAAIDGALKDGKIVPATAEFYRSMCSQAGGLDKFAEFVKAQPAIGEPSKLGDKKPEATPGEASASDEELRIATICGISRDAYLKQKAKLAAK